MSLAREHNVAQGPEIVGWEGILGPQMVIVVDIPLKARVPVPTENPTCEGVRLTPLKHPSRQRTQSPLFGHPRTPAILGRAQNVFSRQRVATLRIPQSSSVNLGAHTGGTLHSFPGVPSRFFSRTGMRTTE